MLHNLKSLLQKPKDEPSSFIDRHLFKRKTTFFTKLLKEDEEKQFLNESPEYKKQFEKRKNTDYKIGADIYSIAMVSLLNPHEINHTEEEIATKNYY